MKNKAIISVYNKTGLAEFASGLLELGWDLYASGGTARVLEENSLDVTPTEKITGISSLLGGRVKTLHPELHAAILATGKDRDKRISENKPVFDLVAVDFYPFENVSDLSAEDPELVEMIDIGGPAMIRAASKNWKHVIAATGRETFPEVLRNISEGENTESFRRRMASIAFGRTALYDLEVSMSLERGFTPELRYGENPHQSAGVFYCYPREGFGSMDILGGKPLSYNNYLDANAACDLVSDFAEDSVKLVLLKHGNPCGAGIGKYPLEAFENAFRADKISPYGGILAVNTEVDIDLVKGLKGLFLEIVLAPSYTPEALERLQKRKKLRVLRMPVGKNRSKQFRSIWGGILIQKPDFSACGEIYSARIVTKRKPTEKEKAALDFTWKVCRCVKSNAIVLGDHKGIIGVGAGQMSRIESMELALKRAKSAGLEIRGSVLASDGFFPFRDGPDAAAEAGISAIAQPGGSIRDQEVIDAADEHGMTMVLTDKRHFRH